MGARVVVKLRLLGFGKTKPIKQDRTPPPNGPPPVRRTAMVGYHVSWAAGEGGSLVVPIATDKIS